MIARIVNAVILGALILFLGVLCGWWVWIGIEVWLAWR